MFLTGTGINKAIILINSLTMTNLLKIWGLRSEMAQNYETKQSLIPTITTHSSDCIHYRSAISTMSQGQNILAGSVAPAEFTTHNA